MTTPLRWEALNLFVKYHWERLPYPIDWHKDEDAKCVPVEDPKRLASWYSRVGLVVVSTIVIIVRIYKLITKDESQQSSNHAYVLLLQLFILGTWIIYFSNVHALLFRRDQICEVCNSSFWLETFWKKSWRVRPRTERTSDNMRKPQEKFKLDILGCIMMLSVPARVFIGFIVPVAVYMDVDPYGDILSWRNDNSAFMVSLVKFTVRVIISELTIMESWQAICSFLITAIMFISIVLAIITHLANVDIGQLKRGPKTREALLQKALQFHSMIYLIGCWANVALSVVLPTIVAMGLIIFIGCLYASVKFQDVIPMPLYLAMPAVVLLVAIVVAFLFPPASRIYENSAEFCWTARKLARSKLEIRMVKAVRPVRLRIGPFFACNTSSNVGYLQAMVDKSIDALMTF